MAYEGTGMGPLPQAPVYSVGIHPVPEAPPPYAFPPAPTAIPAPAAPAGCPPGLEYLTQIDRLLVHQRAEVLEVVSGWEMNNAYTVMDGTGQRVFVATEESDLFSMQVCGPARPFAIRLCDNAGRPVLTLTRPLRCASCCFPCCLQELEVQSPPGDAIGYVEQNWHPVLPKFTVLNERREPQLRIRGPCCDCRCVSDVVFEVTSLDEAVVVGRIRKQWGGFVREGVTDADDFGISFPVDLDVKLKAVMLGACFLIDFMYFENKPREQ